MTKVDRIEARVPRAGLDEAGMDTLAIRAGQHRTPELEHSEPIFPSSSFVYASAAQAAARFAGDEPGNIYSRFTNPTVASFEERIAAMEGGERAVATASGMAAILSTVMALLQQGDHVVCSQSVFGTTTVLFRKYFARFGVETSFVDVTDPEDWRRAIRPETRLLFLETPSNPLCGIADMKALAALAREAGAWFVVDNCFCTPVLQKPFEWGADIVIHSATKYLDGQGRCVGGVVIGDNSTMEEVYGFLRSAGPTLSPFNAWVFLKGLETLPLRMRAHCQQAQALAEWLDDQPGIECVHYAGLPSHPQHELAKRQQSGFGGIVSFNVRGDRDAAWRFIDGTELFSITANLGDVRSTITHPGSTTHGRLSDEEKAACGIADNLVRISVGLENLEDLKRDLQRGLDAV